MQLRVVLLQTALQLFCKSEGPLDSGPFSMGAISDDPCRIIFIAKSEPNCCDSMLHFSSDEYATRRNDACRKMVEQGWDGLLIFRQESMYYLTGYNTSGYTMFQGMYVNADGRMALLVRSADMDGLADSLG